MLGQLAFREARLVVKPFYFLDSTSVGKTFCVSEFNYSFVKTFMSSKICFNQNTNIDANFSYLSD